MSDCRLDRSFTTLVALSAAGLLAAEERARLLAPLVAALLGCGLSRLPGFRLPGRAWTVLSLGALVLFPIDLLWLSGSGLFASVHLLLYLLVAKTHSAGTVRDREQLLVITFLVQLAVCVLAVQAAVVVLFLAYVAVALDALSRLHVAREWSAAARTGPPPPPSLGRGARLATTLLVALLAVPVFFAVPRIGAGSFQGRVLRPQHVTGISDEVDLSTAGRIGIDERLVARVRPLDERGQKLKLLRSVAFAEFDGRRWRRPAGSARMLGRGPEETRVIRAPRPGAELAWFELTVEPMTPFFLPVPDRPAYLRGELAEWVESDPGRTLSLVAIRGRRAGRVNYQAAGEVEPALPAKAGQATLPAPAGPARSGRDARPGASGETASGPYLQLPPLDPRIAELARRLAPPGTSPARAVAAVEAHLARGYSYTLDLQPDDDPLAGFLFEHKAGHCELFASAMAVLLRSAGIPARVVNGFRVGEWSDFGGYYIVRQGDAHAWVEVLEEGAGWVSSDPTPADPERSRRSALASFTHVADYLVFQWDRYVITLSLADQRAALIAIRDWLSAWPARLPRPTAGGVRRAGAALAAGALIGAALLTAWRRRRRAGEAEPIWLYRRLRQRLSAAGLPVEPALGPARLLDRYGDEPAVRQVVEAYLAQRFAARTVAGEDLRRARRGLAGLRPALARLVASETRRLAPEPADGVLSSPRSRVDRG